MKPGLGAAAALSVLLSVAAAQAPIKVEVKLINVALSVRDVSGKFVTGMNQEDFDVFEDGAKQRISFFARASDVPLQLGLLVDSSGSQDPFISAHRRDLETFLHAVIGPRDRAFLLCFGNLLVVANEFTASPADILSGLEQFKKSWKGMPELGPIERRTAGTAFYDAIYHSAEEMFRGSGPGRKALIVFSDGEDNSSAHHMLEALEALQNGNVVLYAVRYTDAKDGRLNARNKYGIGVMERMAKETGGADFDARKAEMAANFQSIGDQLRMSYELAYHSTNPSNDGAFRKIVIQPRREGVTVRAKTGYYAK